MLEPDDNHITIHKEEQWYVARQTQSGIASQGRTRSQALANLEEALALSDEPADLDGVEPSSAPWL